MKSSVLKRALCFICCLSLTLGAFAYRPTKAEAVFVSPAVALGASLLASVVVGTTATFFVESGAADTIGMAIDGLVREFVSTTADLAEYTSDMFFGEIATGAVLLENGAIQLASAAGNLTARFINWLQGEKGLVSGGSNLLIFSDFGYFDGDIKIFRCGSSSTTCGTVVVEGTIFMIGNSVSIADSNSIFSANITSDGVFEIYRNGRLFDSNSPCDVPYDGRWGLCYLPYYRHNGFALGLADGSWVVPSSSSWNPYWTSGEEKTQQIGLQPKPEFQTIPNDIPEGKVLSIGTGLSTLSQDDSQAAADDIMDAIYAGTLDPSIAIGQEVVDTPEEGTDEDDIITVPGTDADLLDWTKYIGQKVASIPQAIGQSVAQSVSAAFAPDPILVNEITGAFSSKFGFVGTLKQVGDDLFAMDAGAEPPVVWIHLEDAEGRYNYGGAVKALDMSWYQRYKPDVDRIFGGFLWIAYLWLLFKRLPDIINGAGMAAADSLYVGEFEMISGEKIAARRSKRL